MFMTPYGTHNILLKLCLLHAMQQLALVVAADLVCGFWDRWRPAPVSLQSPPSMLALRVAVALHTAPPRIVTRVYARYTLQHTSNAAYALSLACQRFLPGPDTNV